MLPGVFGPGDRGLPLSTATRCGFCPAWRRLDFLRRPVVVGYSWPRARPATGARSRGRGRAGPASVGPGVLVERTDYAPVVLTWVLERVRRQNA